MRFFPLAILFAGVVAGAAAQSSQPVRISGGVMAAQIMSTTQAVYPPIARAAHVSGAVVLHTIIGKDGFVETLSVVSGPAMLQASALDAVRQWRWKPYLLNGQPMSVDTIVTVNFNLQSAAPEQVAEGYKSGASLKVPGGVMAGKVLEKPLPVCMPEHKGDPLHGTTQLDAIIGADGKIVNLNVISGPEALRGCVLDAVSQWTYKPYLLNGNPVEVETTITLTIN